MFFLYLITILFLLAVVACEQEEPELDRSLRQEADSIFNSKTNQIASEVDSLCDLKFDSLVDIKFDSIVSERRGNIERLSKPR
jgi:hypothetical protein